jgi:hypothetical protein
MVNIDTEQTLVVKDRQTKVERTVVIPPGIYIKTLPGGDHTHPKTKSDGPDLVARGAEDGSVPVVPGDIPDQDLHNFWEKVIMLKQGGPTASWAFNHLSEDEHYSHILRVLDLTPKSLYA